MGGPLHFEDRRRGKIEVDPDAVVRNAGVCGDYRVDRERREVLFSHRWQLWGVAEFFGRTLWEGATGFTAYGWHWKLLDGGTD